MYDSSWGPHHRYVSNTNVTTIDYCVSKYSRMSSKSKALISLTRLQSRRWKSEIEVTCISNTPRLSREINSWRRISCRKSCHGFLCFFFSITYVYFYSRYKLCQTRKRCTDTRSTLNSDQLSIWRYDKVWYIYKRRRQSPVTMEWTRGVSVDNIESSEDIPFVRISEETSEETST